jgi:ABC-type uncharacterized transport system ATPase subunit
LSSQRAAFTRENSRYRGQFSGRFFTSLGAGMVGSLSVAENLALETLGTPEVRRAGFLRFDRMRERAEEAIAAYDIRCPGPEV